MTSIALYAPGKVRRTDAQVFTLKSGEERDDVQFTVDMSALHTVSGHVGGTDQGVDCDRRGAADGPAGLEFDADGDGCSRMEALSFSGCRRGRIRWR